MLNKDVISSTIPTLNLNDTVAEALQLMSEFRVEHLAVVADDKFTGVVYVDDLLNATDDTVTIATLQPVFSKLAVHADKHFIEAVQLVNEYGLTVIPVIEGELEFIGVILQTDLFKQLAKLTGANEPGGIIVLELEKRGYSFSEISKLVETNDAQITQLNSYYDNNSETFIVTIKVNRFEVSDIVATFQRYEYVVKFYFGEELYENELRTNYDHLMNYLNM
ncbi:MAG TPA: CBS domain-containing protein [Chitinophagaceae bacterium]|nr:CBS domain-containing protein [Chitinophagaceae bacterium]